MTRTNNCLTLRTMFMFMNSEKGNYHKIISKIQMIFNMNHEMLWVKSSIHITFTVDNNGPNNAFVRCYSLQSFFHFLGLCMKMETQQICILITISIKISCIFIW